MDSSNRRVKGYYPTQEASRSSLSAAVEKFDEPLACCKVLLWCWENHLKSNKEAPPAWLKDLMKLVAVDAE
eukprot:4305370-Prorocentrum_lima.AAC.1